MRPSAARLAVTRASAPAVAVVLVLLAGCLAQPAPEPAASAATGPVAARQTPFEMTAAGCVEAGFVAGYGARGGEMPKLAEVWQTADIREEIGNPTRDATGIPVVGPLFGNWHMGFRCATADTTAGPAEDFVFGYVGEMVEPPAWDTGGADLHFLLSGLSFANGTIGDAARNSTIADVTHTAKVEVDWRMPKELPRSAVRVEFLDAEKGLYESDSTMSLYRDVPERTIRLWWQVPTSGVKDDHAHSHDSGGSLTSFGEEMPQEGAWHPIYWDLRLSGGAQYTTPSADGLELASHNRFTFQHGPVAAQPCVTNIYESETIRLSAARVVDDVTLSLLWTH